MSSNSSTSSKSRSKASSAGILQNKGRTVGVPNYQATLLLDIIEDAMSIGSLMWQTVAKIEISNCY